MLRSFLGSLDLSKPKFYRTKVTMSKYKNFKLMAVKIDKITNITTNK